MTVRKRVNVKTSGIPRNILTIEENSKGDIYIRLKSGTGAGIAPYEKLKQHRYSIHPSPKSQYYTTLKTTLEFANKKITSVALTTAVKSRKGFSHLCIHRFAKMEGAVNDITDDGTDTLTLFDFIEAENTLVLGIFIGHVESVFPSYKDIRIFELCISDVKLVLCFYLIDFPAIGFFRTMDNVTFAPEIFKDDLSSVEAAKIKMDAKSPGDCINLYMELTCELLVNLLETCRDIFQDAEAKAIMQSKIDSVPRGQSFLKIDPFS